jgi:hypothetical protein
MRASRFTIDTYGGETFEGFTLEEDWNGWACPYFTFEQAQHVVSAHRRHGWEAVYDAGGDRFVFTPVHSAQGEEESYEAVEVEGRKLYSVGAFNWIWEEAAGDEALAL